MTTKKFTFKFYNDPGHGWMAVKKKLLVEYGVADKISSCSYVRGQTVYLEEDCDAHMFLNALVAVHGKDCIKFDERHCNNQSPIRSYNMYQGA